MATITPLRKGRSESPRKDDTSIEAKVAEALNLAEQDAETPQQIWDRAEELLLEWMDNDPVFERAMLTRFRRTVVRMLVRQHSQKEREAYTPSRVKGRADAGTLDDAEAAEVTLAALSAVGMVNLLEFPLEGGMRLGRARKGDLLPMAARWRSQASIMAVRARWLELIAARLGDDQVVHDALDNLTLHRLLTEAERVEDASVA